MQPREQYYHTTNSKLATTMATLGVPFHNPEEPCTSVFDQKTQSVQTTWRFAHVGRWQNKDASEFETVHAAEIGKAWHNPGSVNLSPELKRELMLCKLLLENRELLYRHIRGGADEQHVAEAILCNNETMEKAMKNALLVSFKTSNGRLLYVPFEDAKDRAISFSKAIGIKLS